MRIRTGRSVVVVDVPHLAVATGIVGFCLWYVLDARAASNTLENLLLIEPAAIGAVILYVLILRDVITIERGEAVGGPGRPRLSGIVQFRIFGCMALLGLYVVSMGVIGFDVATVLYVGATLLLLGERRPVMLTVLPVLFGVIVVYAFRRLVTVPVPVLIDLLP